MDGVNLLTPQPQGGSIFYGTEEDWQGIGENMAEISNLAGSFTNNKFKIAPSRLIGKELYHT
ncbi:hypothetical protein [Lentibacillus amyloliquefaciens]|nr:hypothetical protein [Lentibacillus amyloliquefaciens]